MKQTTFFSLSAAVLTIVAGTASASTIQVTYNASGSQTSQICSNCTVTFDTLNTGLQNYSATFGSTGVSGVYTNVNILSADQFGGAGGTGKYADVGAQSGTTFYALGLNKPVNYFGFWFSAADSQNSLQFYSGDQQVANFTTANILNLIGNCKDPKSNSFCGNPNNGQDSGEPFVYLNFFGQNGTTFNRIVFSNADTSTGFESDNHAVAVLASGTTTISNAPEPSTFLLLLIPAAAMWSRARAGSRKNRSLPTA